MENITFKTSVTRYLNGDLSIAEKEKFEQIIEANINREPDPTAVSDQETDDLIKAYRDHQLELDLRRRTRSMLATPAKVVPIWKYAVSIVSICILLIFGLPLVWDMVTSPEIPTFSPIADTNVLLEQMEKPHLSGNLSGSGATDELGLNFAAALQNFEQGNCQASIPQFEGLLKNASFVGSFAGYQSRIYTAYCQIEMNEADAAIQHLATIPSTTSLYETAQWYEGFAYLKQSNLEQATEVFAAIAAQKEHPKNEEALVISQQLKEFGERQR